MSYELAKDIVVAISKLASKKENSRLMGELNIIQSQVIVLQRQMFDIIQENAILKEQISAFGNTAEIEKRITRTNGNVAEYTDENGKQLKICSVCWDRDKKIVQVEPNYTNHYNCAICGKIYFYGEKEINEDYSTEHNRNSIDY